MIYLFFLLVGFGSEKAMIAAFEDVDVKEVSIVVYYVSFNAQFYTEPTVDTIESAAHSIIYSTSKRFFGRELVHLVTMALQEGFLGGNQRQKKFDCNNVRAKIILGCNNYYIDYHGTILAYDNRSYHMSSELFYKFSNILFRYEGTTDIKPILKTGNKINMPATCDKK